jgi:ribulose-phosphate 3-epimerase
MDGHFVPNLTIGPPVIRSLRPYTALPFDVHLMIENPDLYLVDFQEAGANLLTVHVHACKDVHRTLSQIKNLGLKAGVSLSPATSLSEIEDLLDEVDLILVMSVSPGFGGQTFIPHTLEKLDRLKAMVADRPIFIQVDGGISPENASLVRSHGAQVLVAGSAIFKNNGNMLTIIEKLRSC